MTNANRLKLKTWKREQAETAFAASQAAAESSARQRRIFRRLGKVADPVADNWERLMALRSQMEKSLAPKREEKRRAEKEVFQISYLPAAVKPATKKTVSATVIPDATAWWAEQEEKEHQTKLAFTAKAKALGMKRKEVLAALETYAEATDITIDPEDPRSIDQLPGLVAFIKGRELVPA